MVDKKSQRSSDNGAAPSFKIVMLGDTCVGKTCIVNRFIKGGYFETEATVAQDFKSKTLSITKEGQATKVRLQIWDTAGSEEYRSLTGIYYKNAHAFCLVYDSTSAKSLDALRFWIGQIKEQVSTPYDIFLIAAKIDKSEDEQVTIKEASEYAKSIKAELH